MTSKSWGDLKKQADDASKPIPNDWYDVIITKADLTTASTGSLMIKVQLKVVGGPYSNRMLFTNFVLSTENSIALSIFFRNMAAFGLDDAFFATLAGADADPAIGMQTVAMTLVGRTARAEVGTRTWQGQERNEIGQFAQSQGGPGGSVVPITGNAIHPPTPSGGGFSMGTGAPIPSIPTTSSAPPIPVTPSVPSTSQPSAVTPNMNATAPPDVPAF